MGYGVNVFDIGKLVEYSTFSSYIKAALALGNINIFSVIYKKKLILESYIKTDFYLNLFLNLIIYNNIDLFYLSR